MRSTGDLTVLEASQDFSQSLGNTKGLVPSDGPNGQFTLDDDDASELATLAQHRVRESTGLHGFTSLINQHWSEKNRLNLVEQMWRVVYADGRLDDHELHLMRKIQRLLHISQKDFVSAKLRYKPT